MTTELLSPRDMAAIDRLAIAAGPFDSYALMRNAGAAVAAEVLKRHPASGRIDVLCGPGNNGGDGYVIARLLRDAGCDVAVWRSAEPSPGSDAARAAAECPVPPRPLDDYQGSPNSLVVDAIFGAGLAKPVDPLVAQAIDRAEAARAIVVAADLPSGVSGDTGLVLGRAFQADLTVTFFRRKPGHLLLPGRSLCGEVVVADIGIPARLLEQMPVSTFHNHPALWRDQFPRPAIEAHKYARGHVGVFSGGPASSGAARLAAMGAARVGAGAVTLLSPSNAMQVNAAHLTSTMLRRVETEAELAAMRALRPGSAYVLGPGFGVGEKARSVAVSLLRGRPDVPAGLVLDADAITSFASHPEMLADAARVPDAPPLVLTPHEGEFRRLFSDIGALSKLDRARAAAARSGATVVYKGADTVIAAPDGRAAINDNGAPWLATAGSGDVLAGMIAGLLAQRMPPWAAACAAVWLHAEAGSRFGPGLIADDLPGLLPPLLAELLSAAPPGRPA